MPQTATELPHRNGFANRLATLGTEGAFRVADEARVVAASGRDVLHLEIGEPDIATAQHIVDAAIRALRDGATRYTPPTGIPALRDAIARAARARGIRADAEDVVVTSGAKPMLLYALLALVNDGDEVLVPNPGFPIYPSAARLAGGIPQSYPIVKDGGAFRLDLDALKAAINPRTRVLVLNTPHNPTGWIASRAELCEIADLACAHNLWIITDEIYEGIDFDNASAGSIAALPGLESRTIVVDGFSKRYAMTGWRLGHGILPAGLAPHIAKLVINSTSCAPAFVQHAGLAALDGPQEVVVALRETLRTRRNAFIPALRAIPHVNVVDPAGAFFAFADIRHALAPMALSSAAFATRLLREFGVASLPGTDFGTQGEGFLRFSFGGSATDLAQATDRIAHAIDSVAR